MYVHESLAQDSSANNPSLEDPQEVLLGIAHLACELDTELNKVCPDSKVNGLSILPDSPIQAAMVALKAALLQFNSRIDSAELQPVPLLAIAQQALEDSLVSISGKVVNPLLKAIEGNSIFALRLQQSSGCSINRGKKITLAEAPFPNAARTASISETQGAAFEHGRSVSRSTDVTFVNCAQDLLTRASSRSIYLAVFVPLLMRSQDHSLHSKLLTTSSAN